MQGMACCFRALPFRPGSGELSCHRQHGKNEIEDLLARVVFQAICSIGARPPTAWRFQSGRGDPKTSLELLPRHFRQASAAGGDGEPEEAGRLRA